MTKQKSKINKYDHPLFDAWHELHDFNYTKITFLGSNYLYRRLINLLRKSKQEYISINRALIILDLDKPEFFKKIVFCFSISGSKLTDEEWNYIFPFQHGITHAIEEIVSELNRVKYRNEDDGFLNKKMRRLDAIKILESLLKATKKHEENHYKYETIIRQLKAELKRVKQIQ